MGAYMSHGEVMALQAAAINRALHCMERGQIGEAQSVLLTAQDEAAPALTDRQKDRAEFDALMGPLPFLLGPVNPLTDDDLVPGSEDLGESHPVSQQGGD
ncbi:MAG: hypothetical protein A3E01_04545 [Gammaproteobacteria bacterium RIFCSPHIGHO2_12_FULL_63_22]|nr:MAG: hypothetical protein A3E01_04545 [Gammaproteobacteria bacterium RIFCSPHIGHO2_12_FULL_63_22]